MNPEDILYAPDTVAMVIERERVSEGFLESNPYIKYAHPLVGGYIVLFASEDDVDKLYDDLGGYSTNIFPLVLGLLGEQDLEAAGILQVQRQPYLDLIGTGVLIAFIDTGIDYTLDTFRYEDGSTKIQYIWDQTIRTGTPPVGYHMGTEYDMEAINSALETENPFEQVPHRDTVGHGTFLASVAAGRESNGHIGAVPDSELIVVKLQKARRWDYRRYLIPENQENAFSSADLMMAVQYAIDRAAFIGRPLVICISLGTNLGSHDGSSSLENYLVRVSSIVGTAVCVAAGNEAQTGHHTNDRLTATEDTRTVEVRVGGDFEDVYLEMWNFAIDRISVGITSPTGEQVARVPARSGSRYAQKLILERSSVIVEYLFPVGRNSGQATKIQILSATPGVWTITVYGDSVLEGSFHLWLPMTGFISPETVFLTPNPNYTITLPANSTGVITCGAYNIADVSLAPFSSWGPSRLPTVLPDLVAPGVNVGGIYPGGIHGSMSGTSVAAAITSGACALMLQWGIVERNDVSIESYRIRANLVAGCERDPNMEYPNNQWGYGRLNLYNTFRVLRPY